MSANSKRATVVKQLLFTVIVLTFAAGVADSQSGDMQPARFVGPYLGQEPPGMEPEIFAPDLLSKSQPEWAFCAEFNPDHSEFYFSETDVKHNIDRIMVMTRKDDTWSAPRPASFNAPFNTHDSRIAPDGQTIFFRSRRPLPGSDSVEKSHFAWFAQHEDDGWGPPRAVKCGGSPLRTGHLGISASGTLFFSQRNEQTIGEADIYRAEFADGECSTPQHLGSTVNTVYLEGDAYIAPDETFLIVTVWDRPENNGDSDLYISFRDPNGEWGELKNLGAPVNTNRNENCATLSPDGRYLFFVGVDAQGPRAKINTYWVDARILKQHRPSH